MSFLKKSIPVLKLIFTYGSDTIIIYNKVIVFI